MSKQVHAAILRRYAEGRLRDEMRSQPNKRWSGWAAELGETLRFFVNEQAIGFKFYSSKDGPRLGYGQVVDVTDPKAIPQAVDRLAKDVRTFFGRCVAREMQRRASHGLDPYIRKSGAWPQPHKYRVYRRYLDDGSGCVWKRTYRVVNWLSVATGEAPREKLRFVSKERIHDSEW